MEYWVNGKKYVVESIKGIMKVTEFSPRFDGLFMSESDIVYLDNMNEVRDYLTDKNEGVEVF